LTPQAALLVATVLPLLALAAAVLLRRWFEPIPFVLFFLVVSLVAWAGGFGSGVVASVISALVGFIFLRGSPNPVRAEGAQVGALVFLPVSFVVAALAATARAGFLERERAAGELRTRQAELAEAIRVRDAFLSMASHELKTPLTALNLTLQALRPRDGSDDWERLVASKLPTAERQVKRLTRLIDQLLDISRITSGRLDLHLEPLDLCEVVRDVVARFDPELQLTGATLTLTAEEPTEGRWDRPRLEQIVSNLVSNAIKYGERRPISVAVQRRGQVARLVVADQGIGLDPAEREHIFDRFGRGRGAHGYAGFGLGLWIAREAAVALGGSIEVTSEPGRGSIFTVALPLAGPPSPVAHPEPATAPADTAPPGFRA
jgi:two-component system, OmpR family, sensor kinase